MNFTNQPLCKPSKLGYSSDNLERSLVLNANRRKLRNSTVWGVINVCLLAFVLHDISYTCPIKPVTFVLYLEYILAIVFAFNIIYYVIHYIILSTRCEIDNSILSSPAQHSPKQDSVLVSSMYQSTPKTFSNISANSINSTPQTWRSNISMFASPSVSISPTSYSYKGNTSQYTHHYSAISTPSNVSYQDPSKNDSMSEDRCLAEYLKGYEVYDRSPSINDCMEHANSGSTTFWSHPAAVSKEMTNNLNRFQYQLSPVTSASSSSSPSSQSDDTSSPLSNNNLGMEVWRQYNVDKITLTKWNSNIRAWLFQTIVERLVKEIEHIDESLQKHGFSDVKVGCVGIDRLRKTAEMTSILHSIPTLSILLPFLEICSNQEYFMKRLRELAKGGCLSDFKWNSGSSFNGRDWNDSLPTDSEIVMHLFATYMDTQLLPNPNNPDLKPFTGYHYIKYSEKMPVLLPNTLAIQQFQEKPPQYRVIVGEEIYEVMKGYNNLFHSILLFLYHVNKREHGMLGRINLGRAGINIMWIIES